MALSNSVDVSATGAVVAQGKAVGFLSVTLTPAAALATAVVRTGGASGTVLARLQAAASGASVEFSAKAEHGILARDGIHVTLSGAGAFATIEYAD